MKSLHKKIGVGALSAALIAGVPMAGASLMAKSRVPVAEAYSYSNQIRVPFKLEDQLKNKREAAINDLKIVYGAHKIYGYHSGIRINPEDSSKPDRWVKVHGNLANGEEFLGYLKNHKLEKGIHQFNIRGQVYRLQFDQDSPRYREWLLYLNKWQNIQGQALDSYVSQLRNI